MKLLRSFVPLTVLLLVACSGGVTNPDDPTSGMDAPAIYIEAKNALKDGNYETAIKFYERLEARFPYGNFAERAQMEIAYAYYKYNEPESAILAADRFIKIHPNHPNVDYLYYLRGLAAYDLSKSFLDELFDQDPSERDPKSARRAFQYFSELVKAYPKSRYIKDAADRMLAIRNRLAMYEIHVANYYLKRGAYLAAANRGKYVVENYQHSPAVTQALGIMINAYQHLGMTDLAKDTQRVLDQNNQNQAK
ncbi:MAG: outer membrane protein assembly factor BamD [Gammaproteobacteria bacterium]|nr:outer membrane protein assembly factor BamD [Gammaproteobacteria bacterium]